MGTTTTLPNVSFLRPYLQTLQRPQRFRVTSPYNLHNCQMVALIDMMACIHFISLITFRSSFTQTLSTGKSGGACTELSSVRIK